VPYTNPKRQGPFEMSEQNAVVAVYGTHIGAEEAVKELQHAGIDMPLQDSVAGAQRKC
jgi:hypothetical protein